MTCYYKNKSVTKNIFSYVRPNKYHTKLNMHQTKYHTKLR